MVDIDSLREFDLLEGLPDQSLSTLANIGGISEWREGEALFARGNPAKSLHILLSGSILLCYANGRSLPIRHRGGTVGWSSLHTPYIHTADAVCLTEAMTIHFPATELFGLIQLDAEFGNHIIAKISELRQHTKAYWSAERI